MARVLVFIAAMVAVVSLAISGCTQAVPAATSTQAPAAPTKAADPSKVTPPSLPTAAPAAPTRAPTAQPTTVAAKKVDFPAKGKAITWLIAFPAGGSADNPARVLAGLMEKELGTPIPIANKPGAGGQIGITALALAKPDGYTFGNTPITQTILMYLDAERKPEFNRKSFAPIANTLIDPDDLVVRVDSPYRTLKDLLDAAKARPNQLTVGFTGRLTDHHLAVLQLQKLSGAKFAAVVFDGAPAALAAVLGGHVDAQVAGIPNHVSPIRSGQLRALGIMDDRENEFLPGVKTFEAQGYLVSTRLAHVLSAPAGTPREIVEILSGTIKKVMAGDEYQGKMRELFTSPRYMDTAQVEAYWDREETQSKQLLDLAKLEAGQ